MKDLDPELKKRYRATLLGYLSNPDNIFPKRIKYAGIIERSRDCLYNHFTSDDLTDIENEAYDNRKKRCSDQCINVLEAQYKKAMGYTVYKTHISTYKGEITETTYAEHIPPDPSAAKVFMERIEGKVPSKTDLTVDVKDRVFELTFNKYRKEDND